MRGLCAQQRVQTAINAIIPYAATVTHTLKIVLGIAIMRDTAEINKRNGDFKWKFFGEF